MRRLGLACWVSMVAAGCGVVATPSPGDDEAPDTDTDTDAVPTDETDETDTPETDTDTDRRWTDDTFLDLPLRPPVSGSFVDISAPLAAFPVSVSRGQPFETYGPAATGGYFVDLDEDGTDELVITTDGSVDPSTPIRWVQVFRWVDGALQHDEALSDALDAVGAPLHAVVDLDGDGVLDRVAGGPESGLLLGGPELSATRAPTPHADVITRSLGAVALIDADADGLVDILARARSCGEPGSSMTLLMGSGDGRWTRRDDAFPSEPPGNPWTVLATLEADGTPVLAQISGPCGGGQAPLGFYRPVIGATAPSFEAFDATPPSSLYKAMPEIAGGPVTLTEPMGALLADVDRSGTIDLLLATSAQFHHVYGDFGTQVATDLSWSSPVPWPNLGPLPMFAWGMAAMDLDRDGWEDVVVAHGDDYTTYVENTIGPSVVRLYWNARDGQWRDMTRQVGLDREGNWRALVVGDPDRDGDLDLVVGGLAELPRVYRNDTVSDGHGLTLSLRGTTSHVSAVGARVRVTDAVHGDRAFVWHRGFTPLVWARQPLDIGLGSAEVLDRVEVTWPSGFVQVVTDLAAGQLHEIVEPELLQITPRGRHAPADGLSTIRFQLSPYDANGVLNVAVRGEIELVSGTGTWIGPTLRQAGRWTRTLVAPTSAGEAVVSLSLDGVPLRVQPRVWWDEVP